MQFVLSVRGGSWIKKLVRSIGRTIKEFKYKGLKLTRCVCSSMQTQQRISVTAESSDNNDITGVCITSSSFSSFMLACSKPSFSDGTHTSFLAIQSACATPLLRKSLSRKRYLPSSGAGSAMWEISPWVVESIWGDSSAAVELASGLSLATGSASGGWMGVGLTSDLGLTSGLLKLQTTEIKHWTYEIQQAKVIGLNSAPSNDEAATTR